MSVDPKQKSRIISTKYEKQNTLSLYSSFKINNLLIDYVFIVLHKFKEVRSRSTLYRIPKRFIFARCDRGFVQPHSICQPAGAEVQTAGSFDAGRCWGGHTDGGLAWFYTFHGAKSKSDHNWLLFFTRTRLTPVWSVRMIQKRLRWRTGSAPPRPLQVKLLWPRHLKALQPVSRQLQQVSCTHPSEKHSTILSTILIFVSLLSFLNADTAKPPAKSEDLVLSVLIGLYFYNCWFCC